MTELTTNEIKKRLVGGCGTMIFCYSGCNHCAWRGDTGILEHEMFNRYLDANGLPVPKDSPDAMYGLAVVRIKPQWPENPYDNDPKDAEVRWCHNAYNEAQQDVQKAGFVQGVKE